MQRHYAVLCIMGFHGAWYLISTKISPWSMCNLPLCVVPPFLVFFGNHNLNSLFLLVHYISLHSAFVHQAKNAIDFGVYSKKNHSEKTCIGYSQWRFYGGAWRGHGHPSFFVGPGWRPQFFLARWSFGKWLPVTVIGCELHERLCSFSVGTNGSYAAVLR